MMKIMFYIDKLIVKVPKLLCVLICIVAAIVSWVFEPCKVSLQITEGIINSYDEEIEMVRNPKGGKYTIEFFYIYINSIKVYLPSSHLGQDTVKGKESYWRKKLEGKRAKISYLAKKSFFSESGYCLHDIQLDDGSYSYHDPHELSYYDRGWFPFCVTAPTALVCILMLFRYFFLLMFASDETRKMVFGDPNYNPFS